MRFIRSQKGGHGAPAFVFEMAKQEMEWLLATLKLYPQLEPGHHQITKGASSEIKAGESLLEEAMEQHQGELKRKLDTFLAAPGRFRFEEPDQYRFALTGDQTEWMLQVLNDVRVGCWVKLGRPELEVARKQLQTKDEARLAAALEICGYFQMVLLTAFKPIEPV